MSDSTETDAIFDLLKTIADVTTRTGAKIDHLCSSFDRLENTVQTHSHQIADLSRRLDILEKISNR